MTATAGWPLCGLGLGANIPAQTMTYTPVNSTRLRVHLQVPMLIAAAGGLGARLNYGSGVAPGFNGTGGNPVPYAQNMSGVGSSVFQDFYLFGIVSGLAIGTTYWFDLALNTTAAVNATVGHNSPNTPVIFTFEEF
jgi:hypothetical protein